MKKYETPIADLIYVRMQLLETISGSDQGWGGDDGRPQRAKQQEGVLFDNVSADDPTEL